MPATASSFSLPRTLPHQPPQTLEQQVSRVDAAHTCTHHTDGKRPRAELLATHHPGLAPSKRSTVLLAVSSRCHAIPARRCEAAEHVLVQTGLHLPRTNYPTLGPCVAQAASSISLSSRPSSERRLIALERHGAHWKLVQRCFSTLSTHHDIRLRG